MSDQAPRGSDRERPLTPPADDPFPPTTSTHVVSAPQPRASARDAQGEAPSIAPSPRLPLSLRLIGRPSWPGALFVLACAAAFVYGLPWLASALPADDLATPPPAATLTVDTPGGPSVTITLADGWSIADDSTNGPDATALTLVNAGTTFAVTPPRAFADGEDLASVIDGAIEGYAVDPDSGWVISDPMEFETAAGDPADCVTASTVTDVEFTCAVANAGSYATFEVQSTTPTWPALQQGAEDMVRSATFGEASP